MSNRSHKPNYYFMIVVNNQTGVVSHYSVSSRDANSKSEAIQYAKNELGNDYKITWVEGR